ncbi:MAG: hypothetical protein J7K22_00770 [Nanoarchaeota archaeon]|nr:hypothetical protein [Nanoarchaeota archaeon]
MLKVGHRGASAYEPENTLLSLEKAFELGANAVEFDIRKTKDRKLVLMHDKTVDRTTNGSGEVKQLTFKQIRKLDAGKGEKVPTLKEALSLVKKIGGKCLIEIKEKGTEGDIIKEVKRMKMSENVILISFYTQALKSAKEISEINTGIIVNNKIKNVIGFLKLCKYLKVDWVLPEVSTVNKKFVDDLHKWGFKVLVWVVDDLKTMKKISKLVDGIASNKPDLFTYIE